MSNTIFNREEAKDAKMDAKNHTIVMPMTLDTFKELVKEINNQARNVEFDMWPMGWENRKEMAKMLEQQFKENSKVYTGP